MQSKWKICQFICNYKKLTHIYVNKYLCDSLARYGRKLTAQKNIFAMVTIILVVAYIWNLFSIKHYWIHISVKYWASISNIKRMRACKMLITLEIKANLNNILAWISRLEDCIVCQYVSNAN